MKPTVDKVLKDVQLLSKRMRSREAFADELLNRVGTLQTHLECMRAFKEESLEYDEIVKRAESNPRKPLILCLAAENKQLEQLKMQNRTLETSLEEHELTLEMIMSKYREQITDLMRANDTEKRLKQMNGMDAVASQHIDSRLQQNAAPSVKTAGDRLDGVGSDGTFTATEERLAVMAAIAKEVAEQSDAYSHELETELHRLATENQVLRELLAIETANGTATAVAAAATSGGATPALSSAAGSSSSASSSFKSGTGVGGTSIGGGRGTASSDELVGVPNVFK